MESEAQHSGGVNAEPPLDPLANYSGSSLFLRPSSSSSDPADELLAIHNHFRSMALRSPAKQLHHLKSLIDENPALFDSEISSDPTCAEEAEEFPRKRRPALGLQRARFSLKPTKNPSVENLVPSLDIDKIKDPMEFFLAHERLENAKREIQKQTGGVSFEPNQDNASTKPRQRRPGLTGNNQRPVRYRHRYPKEAIDSPVVENTDRGEACLTPLENEVIENKTNDILDGLLCCNSKDLEGDGGMALLQERLQIRPIVLEKASVPDFPDTEPIDLNTLHGSLSKPKKRKALSNIDNLLKGMNDRTPLTQDVGCPVQQEASPTPLRSPFVPLGTSSKIGPRSPFAPLSSLHKYILKSKSKSSVDPFSADEIDHLPAKKNSPTRSINQEPSLVDSGKPSNELSESIIDDGIAVSTSSVLDTVRNYASTSKEDNSGMSCTKLNATLIEDIIEINETHSREPEFDANIESNEPHVDMIVDIANRPNEVEDDTDNMQPRAPSDSTDDPKFNLVNQQGECMESGLADQSDPAGYQAGDTDKCTGKGPDPCLQVKRQRQSKAKNLYRRQSLAAAGTSMTSGVRRSTRIRTRPLEFWKGERMVFGRVHQSLATVIGVKCISPGSDGKPTMKVKSYVSDQYKELLDFASSY